MTDTTNTTKNTSPKVGRLALRAEDNLWKAFYAKPDTLDGAVFLGSIALYCVSNETRKMAFMKLMQDSVSDLIEDTLKTRPTWPDAPQPAPEGERNIEHITESIIKQLSRSMTRNARLAQALHEVRQELWVEYCLHMNDTYTDPGPFNSKPHIRIIDRAINDSDEEQ